MELGERVFPTNHSPYFQGHQNPRLRSGRRWIRNPGWQAGCISAASRTPSGRTGRTSADRPGNPGPMGTGCESSEPATLCPIGAAAWKVTATESRGGSHQSSRPNRRRRYRRRAGVDGDGLGCRASTCQVPPVRSPGMTLVTRPRPVKYRANSSAF